MTEWRPDSTGEWIAEQERAKRVKLAGGNRLRPPFFRYWRTAAIDFSTAPRPMPWDTLMEGTAEGSWTLVGGIFTCVRAGLWEFDGRVGAANPGTSVNVDMRWVLNGSPFEGVGGATSAVAYTSHGSAFRHRFAVGDTLAMSFQAGNAIPVITDNGGQMTWLTGFLLEK